MLICIFFTDSDQLPLRGYSIIYIIYIIIYILIIYKEKYIQNREEAHIGHLKKITVTTVTVTL